MASDWTEHHWENNEADKPFDALAFAKRTWLEPRRTTYRIYSAPGEYVEILAPTASLALKESGITEPYKITRYIQDYQLTVHPEQLSEAVETYVRPILDKLTEESALLQHEIINGLAEAAQELEIMQSAPPSEEAPPSELASNSVLEDNTPTEPVTATPEIPPQHAEPVAISNEVSFEDAVKPPSLKDILSKDSGGEADDPTVDFTPEMPFSVENVPTPLTQG